jgi:hypothetical protein
MSELKANPPLVDGRVKPESIVSIIENIWQTLDR